MLVIIRSRAGKKASLMLLIMPNKQKNKPKNRHVSCAKHREKIKNFSLDKNLKFTNKNVTIPSSP